MELRKNYSNICLYCGFAFWSNRSTARYCCPQHGSMYRAYGRSKDLSLGNNVIFDNNKNIILENNVEIKFEEVHAAIELEARGEIERLLQLKQEYNTTLLKAYNDHLNPKDHFWSRFLTEVVLTERYGYQGPLPNGQGCIIIGDFLIKQAFTNLFKLKPVALGRKNEVELIKWHWVQNR